MSVTVLCPNGRRCCIKVTPGKLLSQILEEACLKSGLDVNRHQLVNQKRRLDLSLPFRLSGLPNNATLEMFPATNTEITGVATIALQYAGHDELQKTTLLSIGISSGKKCLFRYQRLVLTKQQIDEISARIACEVAEKEALLRECAQKKAENDERKKLEETELANFEEELQMAKKRKQTVDSDCRNLPSYPPEITNSFIEEENTSVAGPLALATPCDRRAVIFRQRTYEDTILRSEEINDEFFEIDIDDVRAQLKQLRDQVRMAENRALVSKEYVKQKNREHKLLAYRHTVVRIPTGTGRIVQAQFQSAEPISHLFEWVRSILSCSAPFSLRLALNHKLVHSNTTNFVDADVAPKSTVFIKFIDPSVNFESVCVGSLQECSHKEADNLCSEWLSQNTVFQPFTAVVADHSPISSSTSKMCSTLPDGAIRPSFKANTAPKWFKKK
uniref:TUG-UBL1 domain-containing protein n=1 Tax=Angiostrongylus cantonensis TaxID=6313 RepID=A0A0K0DJX5_ANGCA